MKKKLTIKNQEEFENLIQIKANKIFEDFKVVYDSLENPQEFKNGFYTDLTKQTGVTQSNPIFLGVFDGIRTFVSKLLKGEKYYDAIVKFCDQNKKDVNEVVDYLTSVRGEIAALGLVDSYPENPKDTAIFSEKENQEEVDSEPSLTNTLRQQYLGLKYLLESSGLNLNNIEKSEITRFWFFISGKKTAAKSIHATREYEIVKNPFPLNDKSLEKDLQQIRIRFEKLGLMEVVDRINEEIKSKE